MKHHFKPLLLFLILPFIGQNQTSIFSIDGFLQDMDSGIVKLRQPISDPAFYTFEPQAEIRDGKFRITGHLEHPDLTYLTFFNKSGDILLETAWFYIDPGAQNLKIKSGNNGQVITSSSRSFNEYERYFRPSFDSLDSIDKKLSLELAKAQLASKAQIILDSLDRLRNKVSIQKGIFQLEYVMAHPRSYVGLIEISASLTLDNFGFAEKAFSLLDLKLQRSQEGIKLKEKIEKVKAVQTGSIFPDFTLLDRSRSSTSLYQIERGSFTLIDFWFNSCGYCILQFPDLKAIYKDFHTKGFEVLGITIDKERFELDWKKAIQTHELPWPQFWDFNGTQCAEYLIKYFPSNFLLNEKGVIVARDLDMNELRRFLELNL